MSRFPLSAAAIVLATASLASLPAQADIFVLTNDGQIRGELTNRDEKAAKKLVIRTADGSTVTLDRAQVKQIVPQSAAELEYEKIRPTFADTVEDQWRLAQWCQTKTLTRQRQAAMQRVVELEPEHRLARMALGYRQIDGRWVLEDQIMQERGYVRYKGEWRLPQEIELIEQRRKDDLAQKQWFADLKRWRSWLDDAGRAEQAREQLSRIDDPTAVPALLRALDEEHNQKVRVWYVQALGRIGAPALQGLVERSLDDADNEIRLACLDQLTKPPQTAAVPMYVAALRSKDNARINRAGYALGSLGDKSAIPALMDALVTTHKFTVQQGSGNPNSISAGFSPTGGGGMTMGSSVKVIKRDMSNERVLDALVSLAGGANFGFDARAWKNWYISQNRPATIDARRD